MAKKTQTQLNEIITLMKGQKIFFIAIFGIFIAVSYSFWRGGDPEIADNTLIEPTKSPFEETIFGTGFIKANSGNIKVGSYISGIVKTVHAKPGNLVKKGDVLIELDKRSAEADYQGKLATVQAAEDSVNVAEANYNRADDLAKRASKMASGIISEQDRKHRQFDLDAAKANLELAKANLSVKQTEANAAKIMLDKHTIYAPIDGLIFTVNPNPGEYINSNSLDTPLILMGSPSPLHVDAQIDEHDIWRFRKDAKAFANIASSGNTLIPLKFVRLDPYAAPKNNLNGSNKELIDTRVIHIEFESLEPIKNAYIGQEIDVYIEGSKIQTEAEEPVQKNTEIPTENNAKIQAKAETTLVPENNSTTLETPKDKQNTTTEDDSKAQEKTTTALVPENSSTTLETPPDDQNPKTDA